jgi:uncharacterized membrane protein
MVLFSLTVSERLIYGAVGAAIVLYMGLKLQLAWKSGIVLGQGRDYDRAKRPFMFWYFVIFMCLFALFGARFVAIGLFGV